MKANMNQMNLRKMSRRSGFTLIELLLVMVILVVLAAVVVPKFTNRTQQAKVTAAKTDLATLETALDAYEIDNGSYPGSDVGLEALVNNTTNSPSWHGPYIKSLPTDPWGKPYVYQYPGQRNPSGFDLASFGPDFAEGGNDDITNWGTNQ